MASTCESLVSWGQKSCPLRVRARWVSQVILCCWARTWPGPDVLRHWCRCDPTTGVEVLSTCVYSHWSPREGSHSVITIPKPPLMLTKDLGMCFVLRALVEVTMASLSHLKICTRDTEDRLNTSFSHVRPGGRPAQTRLKSVRFPPVQAEHPHMKIHNALK